MTLVPQIKNIICCISDLKFEKFTKNQIRNIEEIFIKN